MNCRNDFCTRGGVIATLTLLAAASTIFAQQSTEQHIPIGSSPGVSGEYSYIGEIVSVDLANLSLIVEDENARHVVKLTEATRIWLDRSASRRGNVEGSYEDCELGRRVEVKYAPDNPTLAAWIKIETR